jgi:hypothetical protein
MLVDSPSVEPQPPLPRPGPWDMEEREETHPDPSPCPSASLQATDRRELARACPQCPDAKTKPRQQASKAAAPGIADAHRQAPPHRPPFGQPAPAYKKPLRAPDWNHTIPSELLDAGGITSFGHLWTNGRREVEEKGRRSLFHPAPSSSSSPTSLAIAVLFPTARRWAPALADGHNADAPLD